MESNPWIVAAAVTIQANQWLVMAIFAMLMLIMLFLAAFMLLLMRPWLQALMSGVPVSIFAIIGMRLRGNPPKLLIETFLALKFRNVAVSMADVERAYIANKGQVHEPARLAGIVEERLRRQAEAAGPT